MKQPDPGWGPVRCRDCDTQLNEAHELPEDERPPCPTCGSKERQWSVGKSLELRWKVEGAIRTVTSIGRELRWTPPTGGEGYWLLEVYGDEGRLLGIGQGDSFDDAILEMADKLKPREEPH